MSSPPAEHRIVIDVRPGSDPISGTLTASTGQRRSFCGWLDLIGALDAELQPDAAVAGKVQPLEP